MVFSGKNAIKHKITEKDVQLYSVSVVSGSTISQQSIESVKANVRDCLQSGVIELYANKKIVKSLKKQ
jgi:hypothetical protein